MEPTAIRHRVLLLRQDPAMTSVAYMLLISLVPRATTCSGTRHVAAIYELTPGYGGLVTSNKHSVTKKSLSLPLRTGDILIFKGGGGHDRGHKSYRGSNLGIKQ